MYKVEYLPSARGDLADIVSYVAKELKNPRAAARLAEELIAAGDSLANLPYRRRVYAPLRPLTHEYRALRVRNYLLFYWVDEEKSTVTVARVLYEKVDVINRLNSLR